MKDFNIPDESFSIVFIAIAVIAIDRLHSSTSIDIKKKSARARNIGVITNHRNRINQSRCSPVSFFVSE